MSDNRRVYRRIMSGIRQTFPNKLSASQARLLNSIVGMTAGIVQGRQCQLTSIASNAPDGTKATSRAKRFTRLLQNERVELELFYLPFVLVILQSLAHRGTLTLVMDGSETGRGCMTLMVSVLYGGRAIPLVWTTVEGNKGHLPQATHLALLEKVRPLLPPESVVTFLGDGEFDGDELQTAIAAAGWLYVVRTAKNRVINDAGDIFKLSDIALAPNDCLDLPNVRIGHANYGPVLVIAWRRKGCQEPIYLISNHDCVDEACYWYKKRFTIETFFSDQKLRGFNLQRSHLADPNRIARLLIAAALAYFWVIYLGAFAHRHHWIPVIHRTDRCDLGLFQLGLRLLNHFLNAALELPFSLQLPFLKTVR